MLKLFSERTVSQLSAKVVLLIALFAMGLGNVWAKPSAGRTTKAEKNKAAFEKQWVTAQAHSTNNALPNNDTSLPDWWNANTGFETWILKGAINVFVSSTNFTRLFTAYQERVLFLYIQPANAP